MNKTYTERYLVNNLSNKAFKRKYKPKSKKERKAWWNSLSDKERSEYIEHQKNKKAQKRLNMSETVIKWSKLSKPEDWHINEAKMESTNKMDNDEYVKRLNELYEKARETGDIRLAFEILAEIRSQAIQHEE